MTAPRPGFYAATLVFALISVGVLVALGLYSYQDAAFASEYGTFATVLSVGCVIVVTRAIHAIIQHEQVAFGQVAGPRANVRSCPDTHVRMGTTRTCSVNTGVGLTLDADDDPAHASTGPTRYAYAGSTARDVTLPRSSTLTKAHTAKYCKSDVMGDFPYSSIRPFCS
jgi:hypothetical protein